MDIARTSLEIKRKILIKLFNEGLFPYTKRYFRNFNNHFSTIGLVGMNESSLNFKPINTTITDNKGKEFSLKVLDFMRNKITKYQETTNNLYNLEAAPSESTSFRLAKHDKEKYPDIITSGEKDPFYTNSTQLPVDAFDNLFDVLDHQEELQRKYTGGTVVHSFIGEAINDIEIVKKLVRKIANNYRIPYFTITPTYSICPEHGYISGEQPKCPYCESECEVYSRIVGYYRPVKNWNKGKKSEFKIRKNLRYNK